MKSSSTSSFSSSTSKVRFRIARAFKALDDGNRKKWVLVVAAHDLPANLPLDANARIPNVIKNATCAEQRETLLKNPELFQVFNGGIVCTATNIDVSQEGDEKFVEVSFDPDAEQGIVNGGHTYANLLLVLHNNGLYAEGKNLQTVLTQDAKKGNLAAKNLLIMDNAEDHLVERIARAHEQAYVQVELVAPVADADLLVQIARARNLSLGVEATALANLAGKFDFMKKVLASASAPFGPSFVERVVWKTNQEVPEDSKAIPVKLLIDMVAMMDFKAFPPDSRVANQVFTRSVLVIREFSEAEGDAELLQQALTSLLPEFIQLYDHIYKAFSLADPTYPWSDGKLDADRKRRRSSAATPLLGESVGSRVANAFLWPVYSAFRSLLVQDEHTGAIRFTQDPLMLFDEMRDELIATVKSFHQNQAHGLVTQVGKDKEIWLRLDGQVQLELKLRARLAASK